MQSIVTGFAQNDSGPFETKLRDERSLPFENSGVVSERSLQGVTDLPVGNPDPANPDFASPLRQFDYSAITDAVLHVRCTPREGTRPFTDAATASLRGSFS